MKHKLFSFSAILAAILSLTACGSGESAADVNYSEIAASDGSLVFTTSSTPEISTEPSVEPIIPSSEILEETSTVPATESTTITTSTETVVTVPAPEPSEHQELKVHFLDVGQRTARQHLSNHTGPCKIAKGAALHSCAFSYSLDSEQIVDGHVKAFT